MPDSTQRRTLSFSTLHDILADAETFTSPGTVSLGGWTPAQNIDHVRALINVARTGAGFKLPLVYRVLGRVMRSSVLKSSMKAGFKSVPELVPAEDITIDDALSAFREEIKAASVPGAMKYPSPLLGAITHDEWVALHCRHAELHFGFIVPGEHH